MRLLLRHPQVELTAATSRREAGKTVAEVFPRFAGDPAAERLRFTNPDPKQLAEGTDAVFLALPHGVAAEYAPALLEAGCRVIDLSADFRLRSPELYREFYGAEHPAPQLLQEAVYGLPEHYREAIAGTRLVASPGCYPTSVLLPLLPLLKEGLVSAERIIADSYSAVSGAGRKAELPYLFVECNESLCPYGAPKHRHLSEMEQEMSLAAGRPVRMQFTPHLAPVNRGILTTIYCRPIEDCRDAAARERFLARAEETWRKAYQAAPFVRLLGQERFPDTKRVAWTNTIEIAWRLDPRTGELLLFSAVDNLIKGAGGQAVQSMNLMFGFEETAGLL